MYENSELLKNPILQGLLYEDLIEIIRNQLSYSTRRKNSVVDLGQTTVGARNNEIVQNVGAESCQCPANTPLANLRGSKSGQMVCC